MRTLLALPSFTEVPFAPSLPGGHRSSLSWCSAWAPPRPICQTHGDPSDAPTALWGNPQVPTIETTQSQEPHLHTSLHVHPVPSWLPPKPAWAPLLLWALPASSLCPARHLLPCHPLCPLTCHRSPAPLPRGQWHQGRGCRRPRAPRAAPGRRLRYRLGAGGCRRVPMARAGRVTHGGASGPHRAR